MYYKHARFFLRFLFLSLFFYAKTANADHIAAADMHVDYIGSGPNNLKYKITLTIYKACESPNSALLLFQPIRIKSPSIGFYKIDTVYAPRLDTLMSFCPSSFGGPVSSCDNPFTQVTGYVKAVYTDTVTVPARSADLTFSWFLVARNFGITNLYRGTAYISAGINNSTRYNVSTPRYYGEPIKHVCASSLCEFDNAPYDIQADSLVTAVAPTLYDSNMVAFYQVPYSDQAPIGSSANHTLNAVTGRAKFTLGNTGKYVLTYKTTKYDVTTRQEMAWVTRDVQVAVLSCISRPAIGDTLLNLAGGTLSNGVIHTMEGANLSFDLLANGLFSTPVPSANHMTVAPASALVYSYPAANNVNGHFTWSPVLSDTGLHHFYFKSTDTTCFPGSLFGETRMRSVIIKVTRRPVSVGNVQQQQLHVFPNPANEQLFVTGAGKQTMLRLVIVDLMGQKLLDVQNTGGPVDVRRLLPGYYVLKVFADGILLRNATFVKN